MASTQRPTVLPDTGPDGRPQPLLVTGAPSVVLDLDTALDLIAQIVAALTPPVPEPRTAPRGRGVPLTA